MGKIYAVLEKVRFLTRKRNTYNMQKNVIGWIIFLPTILYMIIFSYRNIFMGIGMSFFETKGFEVIKFIGFGNYKKVLADDLFWKALRNMFVYEFWSILAMFPPFLMAICVNEVFRGKSFFKFALYFPVVVPGLITSLMWNIFLNPGQGGLLNMFLGLFGISPLSWLQDPNLVIPSIIATCAWRCGGTMIYYLAALQSLSPDLYEAAELDGAGIKTRFTNITLPQLLPLIGLLFIMNFIGTFQLFDQPLAMTNGGPNYASLSLGMLTFNYAFSYLQIGRSTATSTLMSIVVTSCTLLYYGLQRMGKDG